MQMKADIVDAHSLIQLLARDAPNTGRGIFNDKISVLAFSQRVHLP